MKVLADLAPSNVHTPRAGGGMANQDPEKKPLADAALVLVTDRLGRILAVSRPEPPHEMSIPGGTVEDGESAQDAAIRELLEETGVRVAVENSWKTGWRDQPRASLVLETTSPTDGRKVSVFRAWKTSGDASALESGTRVAWMEPAALVAQAALYRTTLAELLKVGAITMSLSADQKPDPRAERQKRREERLALRKGKKKPAGSGQGTIHVRADLAPGGALHVRHMNDRVYYSPDKTQSICLRGNGGFDVKDIRRLVQDEEEIDPKSVGVTLVGPSKYEDGTPVTLRWVKVAECGSWKGHPSGDFEMGPALFAEAKANFERRGLPVAYDMEHCSEMPPTSGTIPIHGSPAHGWAHKLDNRMQAGLYALTEWLQYARDGIKAGKWAFLSPALHFDSVDEKSGRNIGARLTSIAITNSPFLTQLGRLKAASLGASNWLLSEGEGWLTAEDGKGEEGKRVFSMSLAHHPNEYMPKVRACLGLHETAPSAMCSERLDEIRGHYEADRDGDGDGMNEGVKLSDHLLPLRGLFGDAALGMTWDEVLDKVQGMIDDSMDEHVEEYHAGGASMSTKTPAKTTATTQENEMDPVLLKTHVDAATVTLTTRVTALETEKAAAEGEVKLLKETISANEKVVASSKTTSDVLLKVITSLGEVGGKDEAPEAVVLRLVEDQKKLLKAAKDRDFADAQRDVAQVIGWYGEKKCLTAKDGAASEGTKEKPHGWLLRMRINDPEAFNEAYPPLKAGEEHLLKTLVKPEERKEPAKDAEPVSLTALTARLMTDKKLSFTDAYDAAVAQLRGEKK